MVRCQFYKDGCRWTDQLMALQVRLCPPPPPPVKNMEGRILFNLPTYYSWLTTLYFRLVLLYDQLSGAVLGFSNRGDHAKDYVHAAHTTGAKQEVCLILWGWVQFSPHFKKASYANQYCQKIMFLLLHCIVEILSQMVYNRTLSS